MALRHHLTLDASEPVRRGNTAHVLAYAEGDGGALRGARGGGGGERASSPSGCVRPHVRTSATATRGRRTRRRRASSRSCAGRCSRCATRRARANHGAAHARLDEELRVIDVARARRASSCCTATCWSSRATSRWRCAGRRRRARCCRRAAGAAPRCPRSSVTSPASRTSTRSPTTCSSGASSTRSSTRCRTSTWTSRATCARS